MDFLTITLGCKVNLYETESLIEYLENKGWKYKKDSNDVHVRLQQLLIKKVDK